MPPAGPPGRVCSAPSLWSETPVQADRFGVRWLPDTTASVRREPQLVQRNRKLTMGMPPRPSSTSNLKDSSR